MKNLVLCIFILSASNLVYAGNLSCSNIDSQWPNDTLEFYQEGPTTYAYYSDGDSYQSVACDVTKRDGYLCDNGLVRVLMDEGGYTTVSNGVDSDVEFSCL